MSAEAFYVNGDEVAQQWFKMCEDKMTWLIEKIEIVKEVEDLKARRLLAALVKELSEAETFDDVGDVSGLLAESEKLLDDKSSK